ISPRTRRGAPHTRPRRGDARERSASRKARERRTRDAVVVSWRPLRGRPGCEPAHEPTGGVQLMLLPFEVNARDPGSGARAGTLVTAHGPVLTPVFMAVGTRATVTGLDPLDLEALRAP